MAKEIRLKILYEVVFISHSPYSFVKDMNAIITLVLLLRLGNAIILPPFMRK